MNYHQIKSRYIAQSLADSFVKKDQNQGKEKAQK